jgi:hypothetical protein
MRIPHKLAATATVGALLAAPLVAANAADAATPFSVTVLHCGGGIHVRAFDTLPQATRLLAKLIEQQLDVPHSLRKIQLRHGGHLLRTSKKSC